MYEPSRESFSSCTATSVYRQARYGLLSIFVRKVFSRRAGCCQTPQQAGHPPIYWNSSGLDEKEGWQESERESDTKRWLNWPACRPVPETIFSTIHSVGCETLLWNVSIEGQLQIIEGMKNGYLKIYPWLDFSDYFQGRFYRAFLGFQEQHIGRALHLALKSCASVANEASRGDDATYISVTRAEDSLSRSPRKMMAAILRDEGHRPGYHTVLPDRPARCRSRRYSNNYPEDSETSRNKLLASLLQVSL